MRFEWLTSAAQNAPANAKQVAKLVGQASSELAEIAKEQAPVLAGRAKERLAKVIPLGKSGNGVAAAAGGGAAPLTVRAPPDDHVLLP